MKKLLLFLLALAVCAAMSADPKIYYVVPGDAATGNDGTSWATALTIYDIYDHEALAKKPDEGANVKYYNGDVFFFAGGTYYPTFEAQGTAKRIYRGFKFVGGCDPSKGEITDPNYLPTYPSATPTIFSGDLNGDGVASPGDAANLVSMRRGSNLNLDETDRYDLSKATGSNGTLAPLQFYGFEFKCTYNENNFPESEGADANQCWGCVSAAQGWIELYNCSIHDNYADKAAGVQVFGSLYRIADCKFYNNVARQTGAALRININSKTRYTRGVVERCSFYNNTLTDKYGAAIAVTAGEMWLVNSTVAGNEAYAEGAGVVVNGDATASRGLHIINSTIAGNICTADPAELYSSDAETGAVKNPGSWVGSDLRIGADPQFTMWNSIIAGISDDGTVATAPIVYKDEAKGAENAVCKYDNFNLTGTALPLIGEPWSCITFGDYNYMNAANTYAQIFGEEDVLANGGYIIPSKEYITNLGDESIYWPPYVSDALTYQQNLAFEPLFEVTGFALPDLTVDQTGTKRNENEEGDYSPGAYDIYVEHVIAGGLKGDANNDGIVDVADITAIAAYILGSVPANFNADNADANSDSNIDVADITATAAIILN